MTVTRQIVYTAMVLVWWFSASAVLSQTSGGVSSGVPGAGATPPVNNPKDLPWKFLASPMGTLDTQWTASITGFSDPSLWDCKKNPDKCTPVLVAQLVQQTVGIDLAKLKPTYVAIHVVDYHSGAKNNLSDSWYLYRSRDSKWSFQKFTSARLYGTPSVLFLFFHLHAAGVGLAEAKNQLLGNQLIGALSPPRKAALSPEVIEKGLRTNMLRIPDPADAQHPITIPICEKDSGEKFQWFDQTGLPSTYANVHYESAVVRRTPANVANLLSILKVLGVAQAAMTCIEIETKLDAIVWGAGRIDNIGLPSDVSIAGYNRGKDEALKDEDRSKLQIGAIGAFNDEQLYWWDASIGIPVHKIKDLQYSTSNNTVVASQVDKQSAYAMFNLMMYPVDLSDPKSNVWPRVLVGFPLSSSPLDRLFAGGAIGIPLKPLRNFQFFAGATFNRNKQPATLTAGSAATNAQLQNDLRIKTTPKFTFGINVPVKSVLDKLLK